MQALYLLTLEAIAETTADSNSYGFRYFRACRDAIAQCFCSLAKSYSPQWLLDADIKACFDEISHKWLLENIPMDKRMLQQWLKCGYYFQDSKLFPTNAGTPQGGILSPTLANMTLDGLEAVIKKSCPPRRKVNFIRYADDCSRRRTRRFSGKRAKNVHKLHKRRRQPLQSRACRGRL